MNDNHGYRPNCKLIKLFAKRRQRVFQCHPAKVDESMGLFSAYMSMLRFV